MRLKIRDCFFFGNKQCKLILIINQLDAQNMFYNKFILCLYMFRASCAHRQEVKIVLYSLWYNHTYKCDDITPIGVMIPEAE